MIHEIVSEGVERSKHFQEYVKEITKALKKYKATPVWDFGLPFDDSTWQKEFVTTRTVFLGMSLEEKKLGLNGAIYSTQISLKSIFF